MTQLPEDPTLAYKTPGPTNAGCGALVLQTLGGFLLTGLCKLFAHAATPAAAAQLTVILISTATFAAGLALCIYLAFRRQPGYLIGFLLASSVQGLLVALCGVNVLR